jgi:uncharacterized membrane protein HdeD (DUF308 family)
MHDMLRAFDETLVRHWWWFTLRGVAAILFGILTFAVPGISLATLILLFGFYALVDGVFSLFSAFRGGTGRSWWSLMIEGVVGIGAGLVAFFYPGLTAIALLYVIAFWAVATGIFEIVSAIRLRKVIRGEGWLILSGILSLAFGLLIAARPGAGALALMIWIGAYAIVFGAVLIALSLRLHREHPHGHGTEPHGAAAR